jgi:hypothetical protein
MTYTVEPHGAGWALYKGRTNDRHGYRLCNLTDGDQAIYAAIADALNRADAAEAEDDQRWLFSQFQAACATLRERSSYRRGPFLVDESDLPIASSGTQSEQTRQSPVCPRKPAPSPPGPGEAKAPLTMRVDSDPRVSQSAAFMTPAESNLQKVQIPTSTLPEGHYPYCFETGGQIYTIPEGFIPWHGGECPVAEGTVVSVRLRGPVTFREVKEVKAQNMDWCHRYEYGADIIAYRIHKPADFRLEAGKYYIDARGKRTRLVRGLTAPMPGLFHDGGARVWKADGTAKTPGDPDLLALSSNQESGHDR